ncbi:single-stranded DNA-binding protein [Desulfoscipio geothermicus]|jgi:single-strand DNA-binding protein|uniref:Single-stranded DNA-binding protein n=1 Tax=Desulfoscipio geothermicus DSM 3669 TaxID=1121426 RepID=A0A1I6E2T1_9FIRM|nr:single-stranded DNA-binding protein [Desulfoscipio geothermicus]SFR12006.1 single-strand binding protein [Desulfoscipio geothermicus DSM 3669]
MLNRVILIGRLAQDPELRYTPNGVPVATFTLAVGRQYTNRQGERVEATDFIDIVVWQKLAETCTNHLGKGRLVAVEGRLQVRSYDDSQGIRRKAAEVVANDVRFLDWPKEARGSSTGGSKTTEGENFASEISFNEDEIPF